MYDLTQWGPQFTESLIQNKWLPFRNDLQIELQVLQGRKTVLLSTELIEGKKLLGRYCFPECHLFRKHFVLKWFICSGSNFYYFSLCFVNHVQTAKFCLTVYKLPEITRFLKKP